MYACISCRNGSNVGSGCGGAWVGGIVGPQAGEQEMNRINQNRTGSTRGFAMRRKTQIAFRD